MNFLFKGAPAEGEGVGLDGKGDPGLPGAPGFQVHTSETVSIILHLSVCLFPLLFFLFFLSLSSSPYIFLTLLKIFFTFMFLLFIYFILF